MQMVHSTVNIDTISLYEHPQLIVDNVGNIVFLLAGFLGEQNADAAKFLLMEGKVIVQITMYFELQGLKYLIIDSGHFYIL
jgi:hypothetical protein